MTQNLIAIFFDQAARQGDAPFLWDKKDDQWHPWAWSDLKAQVLALAAHLKTRGLKPGDRVMLVSENRPEWLVADLAIMAAGGITVPAYTTNTDDDHAHILSDSGAVAAIVSTARLAKPLFAAAARQGLSFAVVMEDIGTRQAAFDVHAWSSMTQPGAEGEADIEPQARAIDSDTTACLIYTSGTGGAPKGVMLNHKAILHNCRGALLALKSLNLGHEIFLSFLPLSHSYEHTAGQFLPIYMGAEIYYAEGIESLGNNMLEVRPTIMTAVPRLYESLYTRITRGVEKAGGLKKTLFEKTLALGTRRYEQGSLGPLDSLIDALMDKLVREKVRARFGGRLKALVSGGAPLNYDIGLFFTALGLNILQGYGQTESAPVISCNAPEGMKLHTVGRPLPDTEVRIAEDGEILVRGDLVMQGYWGRPDETAAALKGGWLHTGDIGIFDEDGHLQITDRKKDIIVNSGGDNISPQRVEGRLCLADEIGQAMVYGDKRPHLVAVLVPDSDWLTLWARENKKPNSLNALIEDEDLRKTLAKAVSNQNAGLSNIEKVRKFLIADEAFTIENELMTPTMKIRRHMIKAIYRDRLEALYG